MIATGIEEVRVKNAKFARDVEYIKETEIDDRIDILTERAESMYVGEDISELKEAAEMVEKLTTEDEEISEAAELDAILNAEDSITFNEMAGIE